MIVGPEMKEDWENGQLELIGNDVYWLIHEA